VKLSSGWVRRADLEEFDETTKRLADLGLEAGAGEVRVPLWQLAQADPASLDALESFGASATDLEAVRALRERLAAFNGLPRVPLPAGLRAEMRPYQHDGLDFLAWTASIGLGAVLADDMGLGKTLQALAWLAHLCERDPRAGRRSSSAPHRSCTTGRARRRVSRRACACSCSRAAPSARSTART
jgi:SNF2 family DNA or RNA helicase